MITVFTGGTGGAKLVQGLQQVVAPEELTVIVNTGDDIEWWGLHVSPDIDSVLYGLSDQLSRERGWGLEGESFRCMERMKQLGQAGWFSLGDLDLATHLTRTARLREGQSLSAVTAELAAAFGIKARVLPMSDDRVATIIETPSGTLSFQEYFVRERHAVEVRSVCFAGAQNATAAPGVIEAIELADVVVFAPSNPVTSIGPIVALPGIREALRRTVAPVVAVSPIIGSSAVSGPAATLMRLQGLPSSARGIAMAYRDFLDALVIDVTDEAKGMHIADDGVRVVCTNILMKSADDKRNLASATLDAAYSLQSAKA